MEHLISPPVTAPETGDVDVQAYLHDFRSIMSAGEIIIGGRIKAGHKEALTEYLDAGQVVVAQHVERTKNILPDNAPSYITDLAEPYAAGLNRLFYSLGIGALRLADRGDQRFIVPLRNPDSRRKVLLALARDYRSTAWHLESESLEGFKATTFTKQVPLYNAPLEIAQIIRQFTQFRASDRRRAILYNPKNPRAFLEACLVKAEALANDPDYADKDPSALYAAVVHDFSNPQTYFAPNTKTAPDRVVASLLANSQYKVFSRSGISSIAANYPDEAVDILAAALQQYDLLRADPRYETIGSSYIARVILRHVKPKGSPDEQRVLTHSVEARKVLDNGLAKVSELFANPRYSEFGLGRIRHVVLKNMRPPEPYLDGIIAKVDSYQANPEFASLTRVTILAAVYEGPDKAEEALRRRVQLQS